MLDYFTQRKQEITDVLTGYAKRAAVASPQFRPFDTEPEFLLSTFSSRGKMIRGGLVSLGYDLFREDVSRGVIQAAAAIELVQSGMLIQDDVMDRDRLRRGEPAIHVQFEERARQMNCRSPFRLARSMAICVGDMAFFHGMALMNAAAAGSARSREIVAVFAEEIAKVGTAQMADLYFASFNAEISANNVWEIYRYKTGRYSFALPLVIGAHLAEAPVEQVEHLERIGEKMGMVFQARDDELDLFGDEAVTGKPVGSDLQEGKRTLILVELAGRLTPAESAEVATIMGAPKINGREVKRIRELVEKYDVRAQLALHLQRLSRDAVAEIGCITHARKEAVTTLKALIEFNLTRDS